MRQIASDLNREKTWVNLEKARAMYRVCNGRAYKAIYKLYDKGYFTSALDIKGKALNKVLFQNFKKQYRLLLSDLDGSLMVTKERFLYALFTVENQIKDIKAQGTDSKEAGYELETLEDFKFFCATMYEYLEAREDCSALRKLIHLPTVEKDAGKALVNPKIYISYSTVKSSIPFDSKAVRECIERPEKTEIQCFPLVQVVIKNLALSCGVSKERLEASEKEGTGIFFPNMTKEMEYQIFSLIVTGDLQIDSLLGESLFNGVLKRYKEALEDTSNKLGICSFKDATYFDSFSDECDVLNEETARVHSLGGQIIGLSQDFVYYVVPSENKDNWYTERVLFSQTDMGFNYINWVNPVQDEDEASNMFNLLFGACGEFVFEKDLPYLPTSYTPIGEPIKLYRFDKRRGKRYVLNYAKAYSILDLVDENGNMPVPKIGRDFDFMFEPIEGTERVIRQANNISEEVVGVARNEVRKSLISIETPSNLVDTATSVCMYLVLSNCGYTSTEVLEEQGVDISRLNVLPVEDVNTTLLCASIAYDTFTRKYC